MKKELNIKVWQILLYTLGFILIIAGLVIVIFWQRGFFQLKWLQCPELEVPFA